jgi:hypothetical protein
MRRALTIAIAALIASLGGSSSALAGGSWLEPREVVGVGGGTGSTWDGWAAPGAVMTMAGDFCGGQGAPPKAESWTAYLRPAVGGGHRIELAPITISAAAGNGCSHLATTTFTVPDVVHDIYWVDVCADPSCERFPGDLMGGWFAIASTSLEAELLRDRSEQAAAFDQIRRARTRLREEVARLEGVVAELELQVTTAAGASDAAISEAARAAAGSERALARIESEIASEETRAERWRLVALSLVALVIVAVGTWIVIRRRRRSVRVPDSPAALFEDTLTG